MILVKIKFLFIIKINIFMGIDSKVERKFNDLSLFSFCRCLHGRFKAFYYGICEAGFFHGV